MADLQAIADRVEIEALRGEFTDAGMMRDYDRFASVFAPDGAWRMPHIDVEFVGRPEIRAGIERMQGLWDYFVQTVHPGAVHLDGDTATGRTYVHEFGRFHDGNSYLNFALYHDRYRRTGDGWKFAERRYEIRYLDTTPDADRLRGPPHHGDQGSRPFRHVRGSRPGVRRRPPEVHRPRDRPGREH